jgi:hypothetical protein
LRSGRKNSQAKEIRCVICWNEKNYDPEEENTKVSAEYILRGFIVCKKHKEELEMQCNVCGSQDTKFVQGISKKTGKPWQAYDCNEPQCKNEKGHANRTFGFAPKSPSGKSPVVASSTLEKKVDKILAILEKNFGSISITKEENVENEENPF